MNIWMPSVICVGASEMHNLFLVSSDQRFEEVDTTSNGRTKIQAGVVKSLVVAIYLDHISVCFRRDGKRSEPSAMEAAVRLSTSALLTRNSDGQIIEPLPHVTGTSVSRRCSSPISVQFTNLTHFKCLLTHAGRLHPDQMSAHASPCRLSDCNIETLADASVKC